MKVVEVVEVVEVNVVWWSGGGNVVAVDMECTVQAILLLWIWSVLFLMVSAFS